MNPRFDLIDILKTLQARARYILIVTIAAGLLGGVVYLLKKKEYKGVSEFFIASPYYSDRNNLFRTDKIEFINYFGREDDIDKVIAIAKSDSLAKKVIATLHLAEHYKVDVSKPEKLHDLIQTFQNKFSIKRTEYTSVEASYLDVDAGMAAAITNGTIQCISDMYSGYYGTLKNYAQQAIMAKIHETDSAITKMTDTLVSLRNTYQIYDIISPSRKNIISNNAAHGTGPGYARGMEDVQTIESIKDQLVIDRAQYMSVYNEFNISNKAGELPLIQVYTKADVPFKHNGFGLLITGIISALVAFFFISLWVLIAAYLRTITVADR